MVFAIVFLIYLCGFVYFLIQDKLYKDGVTFYFAIYGLFGLIMFAPPLMLGWFDYMADNYFGLVLFVALIGLFVGKLFFRPYPLKRAVYTPNSSPFVTTILWAIVIAFLAFSLFSIFEAIARHGLSGAFFRDRVADRLASYFGGGRGGIVGLISSLSSFFFPVFLIAVCIVGKKYRSIVFVSFFIVILDNLFNAAHRSLVLDPVLFLIFYFHFYVKKISLVGFAIAAFALLLVLPIGNSLRRGSVQAAFNGVEIVEDVKTGITAFSTSYYFRDLTSAVNDGFVQLEYGKNYYYYYPVSFVPRSLWPEKPFVNFGARMTDELYGGRIGSGKIDGFVRTFTPWGEGYGQFGIIGVFLASLLVCGFYSGVFRILSRFSGTELFLLYMMARLPMIIRVGLDGIMVLMVVYLIIFIPFFFIVYNRGKVLVESDIYQRVMR